ncbi:hypothetical protein VHUM_01193 [Vanrija humicola]|uniref:Major facilitator superfamily (MFS) profile domain-containing protein n=1 Tax=Vanrija humicola TaxID=5417 RepID=A0A7D8Z4N7_VANHU|nr:hypothetical protein VHUM_01193 [Vanrija humicola]
MFIDSSGAAAGQLLTEPIAKDLHISLGNTPWVIGTYSLAFASTLLFAGRLADLYSPARLYTFGFLTSGVLYLGISFVHNQYAFFVLRALKGVLAVLTIPSSINMIIQMYPDPEEQGRKLALFGTAGALASTLSLIIAGVFMLASWRWWFRFTSFIVIPFSILSFWLLPKTRAVAGDVSSGDKWKRMDLGGVFLLGSMLVCFILSFTQATSFGWSSAQFIAPLVISVALLPVFVVYEQRMPRGYTLLPHNIWTFPNIGPLILQALAPFGWFTCMQLGLATYWQDVLHESAILSAVRLLPLGVASTAVGFASQYVPPLIGEPRLAQPIASALTFAGSMLVAFSGGGKGADYWKFIFTGGVIGAAGCMVVFVGINTAMIQSFPIEFAGVGGSFANVVFQVGGVAAIAIQSGLRSAGGAADDWRGYTYGYIFVSCFILFTGLVFALWYRPGTPKPETATEEA